MYKRLKKLKLWQNSKTQILTKLKNPNVYKARKKFKKITKLKISKFEEKNSNK